MGTDLAATAGVAAEDEGSEERAAPAKRGVDARIAEVLLALVPGASIVYLGFNGGGFFPGTVAFLALLVIQFLIVRVVLAERPFEGAGRPFILVAGVFAAYTAWTLTSGLWSHAADRALIEFDRAFLYLVLLILFGIVGRYVERVVWIVRGLVAGCLLVCGAGLITRVLPNVWPISPNIANNRLSYPVTYWNALGLLATIGALLALALASSERELRPVRALAAATVPIFAATLLFTFSRGAIGACVIGLIAYLIVARPRNIVGALLATVPTTAIAVVVAYNANELATLDPTTADAVRQGHHVTIVLVACALAAAAISLFVGPVNRRAAAFRLRPRTRRAARYGAAALTVGVVIALIGAGAPHWISHEVHGFFRGASVQTGKDLRTRLTDPSNNGRTDHWRVALRGFSTSSFHGHGAATYEFIWDRHRRTPVIVVNAHSLYLQVMSDLGIVGLILIVATVLGILVALARRARGRNRVLWAGLFAAALAWAVHAGIDWDWEMPVITAWVFAAGGAALARRRVLHSKPPASTGQGWRVPIAVGLLVACATPGLLMLSQAHLQRAASAFDDLDCQTAQNQAVSSINVLSVRPQPYQILGYCDLQNGRLQEAIAAFRMAIAQEPNNWEYHYGLALADASSGLDPRPDLHVAAALDPLEPLIQYATAAFRSSSPARWQAAADQQRRGALASGTLTMR